LEVEDALASTAALVVDHSEDVCHREHTTSGHSFLTGDRCRRRPKTVEVVVSADGFYPVRHVYQQGDLKIDGRLEQTVVLPTVIQLEPEEHRAE